MYERLSRDDELQGESNSILNQKKMLQEYAEKNGLTPYRHYTDDGISGTCFARPDFMHVLEDIKNATVGTVVIKDCCAIMGLNQKDLETQGILA